MHRPYLGKLLNGCETEDPRETTWVSAVDGSQWEQSQSAGLYARKLTMADS